MSSEHGINIGQNPHSDTSVVMENNMDTNVLRQGVELLFVGPNLLGGSALYTVQKNKHFFGIGPLFGLARATKHQLGVEYPVLGGGLMLSYRYVISAIESKLKFYIVLNNQSFYTPEIVGYNIKTELISLSPGIEVHNLLGPGLMFFCFDNMYISSHIMFGRQDHISLMKSVKPNYDTWITLGYNISLLLIIK